MLQSAPTTTSQQSKTRKRLNSKQIELLQILYKFRFATAELISAYQEQSKQYTNIRLKILCEQGYVSKNYDSSYKINRRPATYYLLPDAIKLLKKDADLDPKGLHLLYYNRRAKQPFINHHTRLMRLCLKFEKLFGDDLDVYTSTELAEQKQLPTPRPDFFLGFKGRYADQRDSILYLLESTTSLDRYRQSLVRIINHVELDGGEQGVSRVLLVCENVGLEREIQRFAARTLGFRDYSRVPFLTTTLSALLKSGSPKNTIWSDVLSPDKLLSL